MQLEFSFDRNECLCTLENVLCYYKRILLDIVILYRETFATKITPRTVVPTKSDSDVILCLQLLSKTLTCIVCQN